jgi:cytochrome c553
MRRLLISKFLWMLALTATGPVLAQPAPSRLALCGACHGADGNSQLPEIPSLAGQPRVFIENQLVLIREGMRDIPQMKGSLDGVSDEEIGALARHYAAQAPGRPTAARDAALFARGESLSQNMRCGICHLPNYVGREQMPRLAGQREDYLLHSMRMFMSNQALGRDPIMGASLQGLTDEDLKAISHYLSRLAPM